MGNMIVQQLSQTCMNYYAVYVPIDDTSANPYGIVYLYSRSRDADEEPIYPDDALVLKKSVFEEGKYENRRETYTTSIRNPSYFSLIVPELYKNHEYKVVTKKDPWITDEMIKILDEASIHPVIVGCDFSSYKNNNINSYNLYFDFSKGKVVDLEPPVGETGYQRRDEVYHFPGASGRRYWYRDESIVMKEFKKYREESSRHRYSPLSMSESPTAEKCTKYYVRMTPEKENSIEVFRINRTITAEKNVITRSYTVEAHLEHTIGGTIAAYKHSKKGTLKESTSFEVLNFNSKNIHRLGEVCYEDGLNFTEFAAKNEKFLKMCGFLSVLTYSPSKIYQIPTFFLVYLAIVNQYPVIEQIIKMGHAKLFYNLYDALVTSGNKEAIKDHVAKFNEIVNTESTGGKDVLRFPLYIGDYLIRKNADFEEYFAWRDFYELTKITQEQFQKLTLSFNYAFVHASTDIVSIANILKFGYPMEKLLNYMVKTSRKDSIEIRDVINYLTDYLTMCDFLGVIPDKYPSNLKKQHDDIARTYNDKTTAIKNKLLTSIGEECDEYVVPKEDELKNIGIPKLFQTMTVVFPKTEADFINEGNMQHNCVGSYPRSVRNGDCVIFFIRYKDKPTQSFITAECKRSGLGQCYYSNNRYVSDENFRKFARYISNKIIAGVKSGKITALDKVKSL